MHIDYNLDITKEVLLKDIHFNGETNRDIKVCERIQELGTLLDDTLLHLHFINEEIKEHNYARSSQEIQKEIQRVFDNIQKTLDFHKNLE